MSVVYALILDDTESLVLMVANRRESETTWSFPGGAVEPGESLAEAVVREVEEEAGVRVIPHELLSVNERRFPRLQEHALFFTFRATLVGGAGYALHSSDDEVSQVEWAPLALANARLPYHPEGVAGLLRMHCAYHDDGTT